MHRIVAPFCLVLALLAPAEAVENTLTREQSKDAELGLQLALTSRNRGQSWAGFAIYVNRVAQPDVRKIYTFSRKRGNFSKAAQTIAIADRREVLVPPLLAAKATRELGAASLAAEAALVWNDTCKLALMAEASEAQYQPRKPKQAQKRARQRTEAVAPMLVELLAERDDEVREFALLAAAYGGYDDPALREAVAALDDLEGSMAGARLLYLVRTGQEPDEDALAAPFGKIDGDVDEIGGVNPELADMQVRVPSPALGAQALGLLGDPAHLPTLHELLEHDDIRVRVDAAAAIADIADVSSVPVLIEQLGECDWPVLVHVCRGLGRAPSADAIEPLIEELDEHEGRFRLDIIHALSSIAGNQFGRQTAEDWEQWWEQAQGEDFAVDPAKTAAYRSKYRVQDVSLQGHASFYGLPIVSDRFCFVLDSSNSMKGDKIDDLRANATTALQELPRDVGFNVVDFGGDVRWFYEGGLTNDRRGANEYIERMTLTLGTRTWDGTEEAAWLEGIDTLVFLSDGAPYWSQIQKWDDVFTVTNLMNRYRPLAIWTVCFQAGKNNAKSMETWAEEHYGRSMEIE